MTMSWTPDKLLELARSFQPACLMAAAADLDLFSHLDQAPQNLSSLAEIIKADPRGLCILLDALAALNLIEKQDTGYSIAKPVKALLSDPSDTSILAGVQHLSNCLRSWSQLSHTIKTGQLYDRPPSIRGTQGDTESFIEAMQIFTKSQIPQTMARLQKIQFRHLLDIGGASGNWTAAFLAANPHAKATLFDLPQVIPLAQKHLTECHMIDRIQLVSGDYSTDALPPTIDLVWLSAITHQNSRAQNRALFARIFLSLEPNGTVIIRDIVMAPSRIFPIAGALFAVNMLACTEAGNTFTLDEYTEDLKAAGFSNIELIYEDEGMNSLIQAKRP